MSLIYAIVKLFYHVTDLPPSFLPGFADDDYDCQVRGEVIGHSYRLTVTHVQRIWDLSVVGFFITPYT